MSTMCPSGRAVFLVKCAGPSTSRASFSRTFGTRDGKVRARIAGKRERDREIRGVTVVMACSPAVMSRGPLPIEHTGQVDGSTKKKILTAVLVE